MSELVKERKLVQRTVDPKVEKMAMMLESWLGGWKVGQMVRQLEQMKVEM